MSLFSRTLSLFHRVWFSAAVLVGLATVTGWKVYQASAVRREAKLASVPAPAEPASVSQAVTKEFGEKIAKFVVPPEAERPNAPPPIPEEVRQKFVSPPTPISLFPARAPTAKPTPPPSQYLPSFRTIRCQLVTSPETGTVESPLIGIVLEDQYNIDRDGVPQLVIPAGVEVHGTSKPAPSRDRVDGGGKWTFVWRTRDENNAMELGIDALALNRDFDTGTGIFGGREKAPGIVGVVYETYSENLIKQALLASLAALPERLKAYNETVNPFTSQTLLQERPSVGNAALGSVGAGLDSLASTLKKIREQIEQEGYYLSVPAGKEFYLYTKEPIDLRQARRPGVTVTQQKKLPEIR